MRYAKDVRVPLGDGRHVAANVYRPDGDAPVPALLAQSPYPKDVHFSNFHPAYWQSLVTRHPDLLEGISGAHMVWEAPDPERWVPLGYAVVHLDAPGSGKSPGTLHLLSPAEIDALCTAITWTADQPWCTGKVGMLGISYYAMSQWLAASRQPRGLAAIVPWEGASDSYREFNYHGGIRSNAFAAYWWSKVVLRNQHGNPANPLVDKDNGATLAGTTDAATLAARRVEYPDEGAAHPFDDDWHRARSAAFDRITVPILSAGNLGGLGLHLRGNVEGFVRSASRDKWLELHTGTHFDRFSLPAGRRVQQRFLDRFLKGVTDNGWDQEPRVSAELRSPLPGGRNEIVTGSGWPLPQVDWVRLHLDAGGGRLDWRAPDVDARTSYAVDDGKVVFSTGPLAQPLALLGPVALRLAIVATTTDTDVFATLRAFDPSGREVTFLGANDPAAPLSQGWLRASHRRLDPALSTAWRPFHPHDAAEPLVPGEPAMLDVELWPTSIALPAGYRLDLEVSGRDFARDVPSADGSPYRGSGPFLHTGPDRAASAGTSVSVLTGGAHAGWLLLPVLPPR